MQQGDAAAAAAATAAATAAAPQQQQAQPLLQVDAVTRAQAALSDFVFLAFNAAGSIQRDARPLPVAGEDPSSVAPAAGAAPGLPLAEEQARAAAAQLASAASDLREAVSALPGGVDAGAGAEEREAAEAVALAAAAAARLRRARRGAARRVEGGGGEELFRCLADAELARRADDADAAEREE
jgi:trimeric autotransporter adhesin